MKKIKTIISLYQKVREGHTYMLCCFLNFKNYKEGEVVAWVAELKCEYSSIRSCRDTRTLFILEVAESTSAFSLLIFSYVILVQTNENKMSLSAGTAIMDEFKNYLLNRIFCLIDYQ